jgi:hypothetical protein
MSFVRLLAIFRLTLSPSKMTLFLVRPNRQMRITLRAKREPWVAEKAVEVPNLVIVFDW